MPSLSEVLIVIPARYSSSRLPGKPLLDIGGKPMIVRTYENVAAQAPDADIVVATDDDRVARACHLNAVPCAMTSPNHKTGTDRVAEVSASRPDKPIVINVQGDEPLVEDGVLQTIIQAVREYGEPCCGMAPIIRKSDIDSTSVGKVVCDLSGHAMYISRLPIPYAHSREVKHYYTQVCVYGFPRNDLLEFGSMPQSTLSITVGVELLRLLENGKRLRMVMVPGERLAVDTPEDVDKIREEWKKRNQS